MWVVIKERTEPKSMNAPSLCEGRLVNNPLMNSRPDSARACEKGKVTLCQCGAEFHDVRVPKESLMSCGQYSSLSSKHSLLRVQVHRMGSTHSRHRRVSRLVPTCRHCRPMSRSAARKVERCRRSDSPVVVGFLLADLWSQECMGADQGFFPLPG